jgi:hypothetical protein
MLSSCQMLQMVALPGMQFVSANDCPMAAQAVNAVARAVRSGWFIVSSPVYGWGGALLRFL